MASILPNFPPFEMDSEPNTVGSRWTKWKNRFENFMRASNITDAGRKRALLLHYVGEQVYETFETIPNNGEDDDYITAITKLNEHFSTKKECVI